MKGDDMPEPGVMRRSRLSIYAAIRDTALAQRQALEHEDLDRFHELMVERELLIAEAEAAPSGALNPTERGNATALIRTILTLDEANQALLGHQIDIARRELGTIREGKQVLRGYSPHGGRSEARFVDRRT